jgi:hypothetical protein
MYTQTKSYCRERERERERERMKLATCEGWMHLDILSCARTIVYADIILWAEVMYSKCGAVEALELARPSLCTLSERPYLVVTVPQRLNVATHKTISPLLWTIYIKYRSGKEPSAVVIESKGFWRRCITIRTTGILDFVHRPEFQKLENNEECRTLGYDSVGLL